MKSYDAVIIGGGVLGCMAARNLMRYRLSVLLIEEGQDVCSGITRANSAIVYTGYDNRPGSMKADMCVRANAAFDRLSQELELDFVRRGSLLLSYDEAADETLRKKLINGTKSGVPGLRLIPGPEALELEPMLSAPPRLALHAPGTGTVNPWQLGIAAFENAAANGCEYALGTRLMGIERAEGGYILKTDREEYFSRSLINCAGLYADKVREMLFEPDVRLFFDASDYLVMDRQSPCPDMILLEERPSGKGISLIPTVEGNLLIESEARAMSSTPFGFMPGAEKELISRAAGIMEGMDRDNVIRGFSAVRPNPRHVKKIGDGYVPDKRNIPDFHIDRPEPGFISLMGIKSPGLTCAEELGRHAAELAAEYLGAEENPSFDPRRPAIRQVRHMSPEQRRELIKKDPDYGSIVCLCEDISLAEIKEAIARGAKSPESIKRRLGSTMGTCQGSRCAHAISLILEGRA